jgi:hypothetical protein
MGVRGCLRNVYALIEFPVGAILVIALHSKGEYKIRPYIAPYPAVLLNTCLSSYLIFR